MRPPHEKCMCYVHCVFFSPVRFFVRWCVCVCYVAVAPRPASVPCGLRLFGSNITIAAADEHRHNRDPPPHIECTRFEGRRAKLRAADDAASKLCLVDVENTHTHSCVDHSSAQCCAARKPFCGRVCVCAGWSPITLRQCTRSASATIADIMNFDRIPTTLRDQLAGGHTVFVHVIFSECSIG